MSTFMASMSARRSSRRVSLGNAFGSITALLCAMEAAPTSACILRSFGLLLGTVSDQRLRRQGQHVTVKVHCEGPVRWRTAGPAAPSGAFSRARWGVQKCRVVGAHRRGHGPVAEITSIHSSHACERCDGRRPGERP